VGAGYGPAGSDQAAAITFALFSGIWPGAPNRRLSNIDTAIALAINAAILVLSLVGWLPGTLPGN